jgi:hypothetical protein
MAKNITELTDEELAKKIKSAKLAIERNEGAIKEAASRKLVKLEAELKSRAGEVKEDVKKEVSKVEKTVEKDAKKVEKEIERPAGIKSKKFRHKKTGEIVTQVPISKIADYEEVKDEKPAKKTTAKKPAPKKAPAKKPAQKKAPAKKPADKKPAKKKPYTYPSPTEKFELVINGEKFLFSDLESKNECEKATKAVQARYKEVKEHKAAQKEGMERASTIPVTKRISDSFASVTKKAISEIPKTKINKRPEEIKKEIDAVEKAFETLFDKLGDLMGKKIPKSHRSQIMDILTKFENKMDKDASKGSDKKSTAIGRVKKADGGMAGGETKKVANHSSNEFGAGNKWSFASLM